MRKIILSITFLFAVTLAYSQFNLGIKAGYNSSLSLSSLDSKIRYTQQDALKEIGNNFHIGIFTRINFGNIYIQPEFLYSMQRKDYTITVNDFANQGENVTYENLLKLSTVDIPILVGLKIVDTDIFNLRAFAGPKISLNAGSSLDFSKLEGNNITYEDLKEDFSSAKVGLDVGVGFDVAIFTLDARYCFINNMYETTIKEGIKAGFPPSSKFVFSLGVKIL